ncbi:MAG: DNA polymerase III subunit delta [Candidatus Omnitrophica bacterium]|jgi:DNA polymerase-3 subunit delta|nr:DNA polymerase III subunit delta [Candidatus Omnitrophota bacterium]
MVKDAVTLLLGSEATLRDRFLEPLRSSLFKDPGSASLNEHRWDASRDELSDILTHAQTAPFLSDHRLIVIDYVDKVKAPDQKSLIKCIRENSGRTVWVIMTEERAAKTAWLKSLAALGKTVDCATPYREGDIKGWIVKRFRESGKSCDPGTADVMMNRVGKSMTLLDLAVERLTIYCADAPAVTMKDAEALLGRSAEENAFEIVHSMKTRGAGAAIKMVRGLKAEGSYVQEILSPIAYQFEQLLRVKNCLATGLGAGDVAEKFFYRNSYRANQAVDLARRLSAGRLRKDLESLIECEEKIKRGELDETEAIERCVLSLGDLVEGER